MGNSHKHYRNLNAIFTMMGLWNGLGLGKSFLGKIEEPDEKPARLWRMGDAYERTMPHHQGIKQLWETKWKFPCSKSVYPFHDGKMEDFEPVFLELIQVSSKISITRPSDIPETHQRRHQPRIHTSILPHRRISHQTRRIVRLIRKILLGVRGCGVVF